LINEVVLPILFMYIEDLWNLWYSYSFYAKS